MNHKYFTTAIVTSLPVVSHPMKKDPGGDQLINHLPKNIENIRTYLRTKKHQKNQRKNFVGGDQRNGYFDAVQKTNHLESLQTRKINGGAPLKECFGEDPMIRLLGNVRKKRISGGVRLNGFFETIEKRRNFGVQRNQ